jgi:hypothetical protein
MSRLLHLVYLCFVLSFSQGAIVGYVPNPACAAPSGLLLIFHFSYFSFLFLRCSLFTQNIHPFPPQTPGCSFTSAIWNISGVPSAGDDVYITSNEQITIFINYSTIILSSLSIVGNSSDITFSLYSSLLNFTSNGCSSPLLPSITYSYLGIALQWNNSEGMSLLQMSNSTLITPGSIYGTDFYALEGSLPLSSPPPSLHI